jgi:hypothetical protein
MKDAWKWVAGILTGIVLSLVSYVFVDLAREVEGLKESTSELNMTLNETNLLLRANGITWPTSTRGEEP